MLYPMGLKRRIFHFGEGIGYRNHILLYCKGVTVLLAHFKQGSIRVQAEQLIQEDQPLALVGNSGNTSEPHLHIHAVRGEFTDLKTMILSAEPVPMLFDRVFLVRNDQVNR